MLFSYKAKLKDGSIFEGTMEALDRFALAKELRSHGSTPISVNETKKNFLGGLLSMENLFGRVKNSELIVMTNNLAGMLKAGLSLSRSLSVLEKQTRNSALNKILLSLNADISSGETLSFGLAKFPKTFSKLFVSMTKAGEESGNFSGALSDVATNLEKANSLTKKIKGAMIYPGVILSAMVIIGVLMFAFVVPTLAATFKDLGVELPLSTKVIVATGNFFSNHLILSFLIIIFAVVGVFSLFRAKFLQDYIDLFILKLPVIGVITKELNTARTARTMSSLLLAGVSLTRSVEITEDVVQNVYYKRVLSDAKESVEKGVQFSAVFQANSNLYPIMMSEMVEVGEETGKLSDMLLQIALFYEESIENKTRNLSTIIEPVLMVIIGAAVGFFAISMISPLYSVLDNIK